MPQLPVTYIPQENVQAVKDANAVTVEVKADDLQPTKSGYDWGLIDRINYFGVRDAAKTVQDAFETELKARGFKIGSGATLIVVQIDRFEADVDAGMFDITTSCYLWMRVTVHERRGKVLYSKDVNGESPFETDYLYVTNLKGKLAAALEDATSKLFADPAFTSALLATRHP